MMRATTTTTLLAACVTAAAVGCAPVEDDAVADMEADLPTSPTAVRVALFDEDGAVDDASTLRAWPAWYVANDGVIVGITLVDAQFSFTSRTLDGVVYPTADVEFGAPPAEVLVVGAPPTEVQIDGDEGTGTIAFPVVLVVAADVPLDTVGTLGALADDAPLGLSTYLAFGDGALQIETTDGDTGEASTFLSMPLSTVGGYRAYDASLDAPYLMSAPLQ